MTQSNPLIIYPEIMLHKISDGKSSALSPQTPTLLKWIQVYLDRKVVGIQSRHTLEAKARDLLAFAKWFQNVNGHSAIEDWRPRDTQAFLTHLEKLERAATTINRVFASLRHFARWVHAQANSPFEHGLPTQDVTGLAVDEPDCKKLSTRELHRLFKAADNLVLTDVSSYDRPRRNRAILAMLYYTGLRVSELTGLNVSQYKDKNLFEIKRKGKTRTKEIYLSTNCRKSLDDYLDVERIKDDPRTEQLPLFLSVKGAGYLSRQQVSRILLHIAAEANKHADSPIQIHPHRLRHTFGAEFREKSGSDTETQQALGHVSLDYVGRYVRKTPEERQNLMERIGDGY